MANPRQAAIDAFEEKAIGIIMAEGFDREEAEAILEDWLHRKWKRMQAQRFEGKLRSITAVAGRTGC